MIQRRRLFLLGGSLFLMLLSCSDSSRPPAEPAPRTISLSPDGSGDYPSIQMAIDAASNGDTLALADGIFSESGNVDLDLNGKALVVRSVNGDPAVCIISCQGSPTAPHRGFLIQSGESRETRIEGITIADGYAAGPPGSIDQSGGGVHCRDSSSPTFVNCVFRDCSASHCGGGMTIAHDCDPALIDCNFLDNSAVWGGGICIVAECHPTISDCSFTGNTATYDGGGIYCQSSASIVMGCDFEGNAARRGAGIHCTESSVATVDSSTFHRNSASYTGAALCCQSSNAAITQSTLVENAAVSAGAGLFGQLACSLTVAHSIIAFSTSGEAVHCSGAGIHLGIYCSNLYGNAAGDWVQCAGASAGVNGNLAADPLFIAMGDGDFHLLPDSPCGFDQTPCGLIGAWGYGD